jgi:hypothetical protein
MSLEVKVNTNTGKPYWMERLGTVDLLVLTSFRSAVLYIQSIITLCYKTSYINEEINCTEPSPLVSVPWPIQILTRPDQSKWKS